MQKVALCGTTVPAIRNTCAIAARDWAQWLVGALAVLVIVTRIPLLPKYLYYFDSVNFALALDDFNPAKHQPQPPGYPAFVLLARLLYAAFPTPEIAFALAGLIAALAALYLTWRTAESMFGAEAGLLAAGLLALNPPFWFGGVTNEVRLCLALNSTAVGLVCWQALQHPSSRMWFLASCAVPGLMAGFRPVETLLLLPLILLVWWRTRRSAVDLLVGAVTATAAVLPWIAIVVTASGGIDETLALIRSYGRAQLQSTSLFFGASAGNAFHMAKQAFIWNCVGAIPWIWAVPFARRRLPRTLDSRAAFLAVWFLPGFLFSALIHIGDPDQALLTIPVLCIAGGAVLHAVLRTFDLSRAAAVVLCVLIANAALFLFPPGRIASAASFSAVHSIDERTQSVFHSIRELGGGQSATLLHYGGIVTWRHLFYYFPQHRVMYLPPEQNQGCMTLFRRELEDNEHCAAVLAPARRYILLAPHLNQDWLLQQGWQRHGLVYWREATPGLAVELGRYRLKS